MKNELIFQILHASTLSTLEESYFSIYARRKIKLSTMYAISGEIRIQL